MGVLYFGLYVFCKRNIMESWVLGSRNGQEKIKLSKESKRKYKAKPGGML